MKKTEYHVLGLCALIANVLVALGSILIVMYIKNALQPSLTEPSTGGIQFAFIVFILGLTSVFVSAVYQFIYFFLTEKKKAVLISGVASLAVFLIFILSIVNILISFSTSIFTGEISTPGMLIFCIMVAIASAIFHGLVYFQLNKKVKVAFLTPMMPEKIKAGVIVEEQSLHVEVKAEKEDTTNEE